MLQTILKTLLFVFLSGMAVEDVVSAKLVLSKLKEGGAPLSQWSVASDHGFFRLPGGGGLGEKMSWVLVQLILTIQKRHFYLPSRSHWVLWGTLASVIWRGSVSRSNPLWFFFPIWKEKVPLSYTFKLLRNATHASFEDSRFFYTAQYKPSTSFPTVHSQYQYNLLIHYFVILTRTWRSHHFHGMPNKLNDTATRSSIWNIFIYFSFHIPRQIPYPFI